ncbi:hypothetical protein PF005_g31456 [Phytophthora fragariae]|uniref:Uncharacterized protein n=1 Tax=Phytophthora fragariae TaxID=53985 RepID=A0A6A3V6N3_9STRA|nr:hypothetical protein PF003_g33146 [Phytophthora fragariae]KAE9160903.1 hypothetical protein PF005_g31456 [Phytophthora fragariae]
MLGQRRRRHASASRVGPMVSRGDDRGDRGRLTLILGVAKVPQHCGAERHIPGLDVALLNRLAQMRRDRARKRSSGNARARGPRLPRQLLQALLAHVHNLL